jgi:hypothetical protein
MTTGARRIVRNILAVVLGLVAFTLAATVCGWLLRVGWPDYASAEPVFGFTLGMQLARLAIGAVATLAAGAVAGAIAKQSRAAVLATGIVLVVIFVPIHVTVWDKFPIWYHLVFLSSLVPLTVLGGRRRA